MRRPLMVHFALGVLVLLAAARVASAQTTVAANYDLLLHELSENSSLGGHGDVATKWGPIDVLAEVGVNHFSQVTVITLAPGVRYHFDIGTDEKWQPAVQVVFGWWHCGACETNASFLQGGGLVDYRWSDDMKFRVQFDVRQIFFNLGFGSETAERLSVGVVFKF